jgi:SAM-dependent methyltransferase
MKYFNQFSTFQYNRLKYFSMAFLLKIFSINNFTSLIYRRICNLISPLTKKNLNIDSWKLRGDLLISILEKYNCLKKNDKVFETGTGWFHFYSIYTRIFYDVSITMFDIWDNRQWSVFKSNFKKLDLYNYSESKKGSVTKFIKLLNHSESYDELYKKLNLKYLINPNGSIYNIESDSYNLVISFHVLEHIPPEYIEDVINDFYRILKPGSYCIHQIGCDDHLAHGTNLSSKNYLKYSPKIWSRFFENKVQFTNRLQMKDFIDLFLNTGFKIIEKRPEYTNITQLSINKYFSEYSKEDLECSQLTVVFQK